MIGINKSKEGFALMEPIGSDRKPRCFYDCTLNIDVDAARRAYSVFRMPPISVREDAIVMRIVNVESDFSETQIFYEEHQSGVVPLSPGGGIHTISYGTTLNLPCDATLFATRIHPLDRDGQCPGVVRYGRYKSNYWTPFILPPNA